MFATKNHIKSYSNNFSKFVSICQAACCGIFAGGVRNMKLSQKKSYQMLFQELFEVCIQFAACCGIFAGRVSNMKL